MYKKQYEDKDIQKVSDMVDKLADDILVCMEGITNEKETRII